MNAVPTRTVIRLTLAGTIAAEIDPADDAAVRAAMGRMFAAKNNGDTTAAMVKVEIPGSIATDATDASDASDDDETDDPTVQVPAVRNPLAGLPIVSNGDVMPGFVAPRAAPAIDTRVDHTTFTVDTTSDLGSVGSTVRGGEISAIAVQRIALQDEWARKAGFALPAPVYAAGTRCVDLGDQNFRAIRQSVDSMPRFDVAARMVSEAIAAEQRRDIVCSAADVVMGDDGTITLDRYRLDRGKVDLAFDVDAFRAFCHRTGNGVGAGYLASIPAPRRAANVNADLVGSEAEYMLRTRNAQDGRSREIFAVLSPGYAVFDADRVMALAAPHLADTNAEVVFDGSRLKATALWMPDHVVDLAAGDVFKAGVRITTSDVGGGSIKVDAVLWRNRCLNLIIVGSAEVNTCKRVHKGKGTDIAADVDQGIRAARDLIAPFLGSWGKARRATIGESEADILARIESIVAEARGGVKATKAEREKAVPAILDAWRAEPGFTVADLANALTRAAHQSDDFVADYRAHLERRAGQLVLAGR